jgi:hypothetical protein
MLKIPMFYKKIILWACVVVCSMSAQASNLPQVTGIYRYQIDWIGVHVGDMVLEYSQKDQNCSLEIWMFSRNIAWLISKFRGVVKMDAPCENATSKGSYRMDYFSRKKNRIIAINYTPEGEAKATVNPPEPEFKRPPVPTELLMHTENPLSVVQAMRQALWQKPDEKNHQFQVFDGRKRLELTMTRTATTPENLQEWRINDKPIAGYGDRDMENFNKRKSSLFIYIDGKKLMPTRAEGRSILGTAKAKLLQSCKTVAECVPEKDRENFKQLQANQLQPATNH